MRKKPILNTYADYEKLFKTCGSKKAGKPLPGGWRLHKDGDIYTVSMRSWERLTDSGPASKTWTYVFIPMFTVSPSNVLEFVLPNHKLLARSNSIVMTVHKVSPLGVFRVRSKLYSVGVPQWREYHWRHAPQNVHRYVSWTGVQGAEYFVGLKFQLGENIRCLNPRTPEKERVIPEVQRQWRGDVIAFKRGLKARAAIGAFLPYASGAATSGWVIWGAPGKIEELVDCIRTGVMTEELMADFAAEARHNTYRAGTPPNSTARYMHVINHVLSKTSLQLRRVYGVFGKQGYK